MRYEQGAVAVLNDLMQARADFAACVAPIVARDSEARQLADSYQAQVLRDIAQVSPEQLAALQRFADGDQQAGFDQYQAESARRRAARQAVAQAAAQAARTADAADARGHFSVSGGGFIDLKQIDGATTTLAVDRVSKHDLG